MNRYVIEGVLRDMLQGKRIFWVSERQEMARLAFDKIWTLAEDNGFEFRSTRASGDLRIDSLASGGSIRFIGDTRLARGLTTDILVLHGAVERVDEVLPMHPKEVFRT